MVNFNNVDQIVWLYKLAREEYTGDINLLLLEMNIQGVESEWNFLNESNQLVKIK